jgi:tRNA pseudouridine38-40 synthase
MTEASQVLVGSHDFAAFGKPPQGESTVRHVLQAGWSIEHPRGISGRLLVFDITANAFLYRMVRNIVGTLVLVGQGELSPDGVADLLGSKDRGACGPPAPPCGLCLVKVAYPEDG